MIAGGVARRLKTALRWRIYFTLVRRRICLKAEILELTNLVVMKRICLQAEILELANLVVTKKTNTIWRWRGLLGVLWGGSFEGLLRVLSLRVR